MPEVKDPTDTIERFEAEVGKLAETARFTGAAIDRMTEDLPKPDRERQSHLKRKLSTAERLIAQYKRDAEDALRRLKDLLEQDAKLDADVGNIVVRLRDLWRRAMEEMPRAESAEEEAMAGLRHARADVSALVLEAAYVTIIDRVEEDLDPLAVGQALDFRVSFADEVKDTSDQDALLKYLKQFEGGLHPPGVVDVEHGLIIRGSDSMRELAKSLGLVLTPILLGALIVGGLTVPIAGMPSLGLDLLGAYGLLFLGALFHLWIDTVKRRADARGVLGVKGRWGLWVEAKDIEIFLSVLTLLLVYVLFIWFERDVSARVDLVAAFVTGYSSDSFVDLFLKRFDVTVAKKIEDTKTAVAAAAAVAG